MYHCCYMPFFNCNKKVLYEKIIFFTITNKIYTLYLECKIKCYVINNVKTKYLNLENYI